MALIFFHILFCTDWHRALTSDPHVGYYTQMRNSSIIKTLSSQFLTVIVLHTETQCHQCLSRSARCSAATKCPHSQQSCYHGNRRGSQRQHQKLFHRRLFSFSACWRADCRLSLDTLKPQPNMFPPFPGCSKTTTDNNNPDCFINFAANIQTNNLEKTNKTSLLWRDYFLQVSLHRRKSPLTHEHEGN